MSQPAIRSPHSETAVVARNGGPESTPWGAPSTPWGAPSTPFFAARRAHLAPDTVVDGRYKVLREIACGGGGIVFEAEHVHTRARVALKTMTYASLSRGRGGRILREARALGRLRHPNIVPVLDAGQCREHGPFVVLALVDGRTLESFVSGRSRLDVEPTVALIVQLASALSHLARRGVVHRDVKPSNVLIVPGVGGEPDTAVLIDFGVAKLEGEEDCPEGRVTLDGDLIGTPEYMAPEQVSARGIVDHRTDVYGLAALAYECLTGVTPYTGHTLAVVSSILLSMRPDPVSQHRPDVPPALGAAIERALSRNPEDRFTDAQTFAHTCLAALGGEPSSLYLFPRDAAHNDTERPEARRKALRVPYQAPARVLVGPRAGYDAKVEDISTGGLLLSTTAELAPQTEVSVRFPLPMSGKVVTLGAKVKWSRARGSARVAGVEFASTSEEVELEVEAFSQFLD